MRSTTPPACSARGLQGFEEQASSLRRSAWKAPPSAGRRLGTTRRADGSLQATDARRALYYYVGDRKPGQILCQNAFEYGGFWRVVLPSGGLVKRS